MPHRYLEAHEANINRTLKRNTLVSGIFALAGFSLLIPAFSLEGTKFDYQEFCFQPPVVHSADTQYCTGEKIRRGVAWRVALERATNQEFKSKVTELDYHPAQNPNAGVYGLCGAAFFLAGFFFFKDGTEQLEGNLDVVVGNKKALVVERALEQGKHLNIQALKVSQEEEFIKEIMQREHGDAMYSLMEDGEKAFIAQKQAIQESSQTIEIELQTASLQAQIAEQREKEARHKVEIDKLNRPLKTSKSASNDAEANDEIKRELIEKLKAHEEGWLHTLCTTRKVLIIEGEQGSFKSYTAALIAYLRYQLKGHKLGWIVDSDYHQNKKKAWNILQSLEFDAYGANKDGEGIKQGIERFLSEIQTRDEDNCDVETIIFDELTTYEDYEECKDNAKSFMKFALSAPRKANFGLIAITHANTNAGTGGGGGMAASRKRGALHLLLNADNDYQPTFQGVLNGFKNDSGQLIEDMAVTLPDWFRPDKLQAMFEPKGKGERA